MSTMDNRNGYHSVDMRPADDQGQPIQKNPARTPE